MLRRGSLERTYIKVARLVLLAFVGPCPNGKECCHADDVQTNNRLDNLRWDTREANRVDGLNNRTKAYVQSHPRAKMTSGRVLMVRAMYETGIYQQKELAGIFSVSLGHMSNIINRRTWKHLA